MVIQTPWQYWEHNIQNQDKQSKNKYTIQHRKLSVHAASQSKLEKTEGTTKNGQSRDTANIRHTRHKTKTNKVQKYNTTQKKINSFTYILCSQDVFDRPHQTLEVNSGAREGRQLLSLIREPQFY
jgi:hypothetical protein